MRKISIVQRRLETGLDLTQAELRALQREASFQPDELNDSGRTVTAFENPLSFLPPTRPVETPPQQIWQQEDDSKKYNSAAEKVEDSGEGNEISSTRIPDGVGRVAGMREGKPGGDSYREPPEYSSASVREDILSSSGEEIRAAVNEIFANEDFSFEPESVDLSPENESAQPADTQLESDGEAWQSEREVLFPSLEPPLSEDPDSEMDYADPLGSSESSVLPSDTDDADEGESTGISELSAPKPVSREETLVLFLLQVPGGGLGATFSASEDAESPFAGQLRLRSECDEVGAIPGEASQFDVNLPPEGLVRLSTGRVGNNGHEWALITLDEEANACATFDLRAGRNLRSTAAVFSKSPSRKSSLPLRTSPFEDNGFVLANPTDGPVVVRLKLLDEQGNELSTAISQELNPLPAGKQVAIFGKSAFRNFPGIKAFKGRMVAEVLGEGLIWTAGLNQNDGVLSFLPVAEMRQSSESRLTDE